MFLIKNAVFSKGAEFSSSTPPSLNLNYVIEPGYSTFALALVNVNKSFVHTHCKSCTVNHFSLIICLANLAKDVQRLESQILQSSHENEENCMMHMLSNQWSASSYLLSVSSYLICYSFFLLINEQHLVLSISSGFPEKLTFTSL